MDVFKKSASDETERCRMGRKKERIPLIHTMAEHMECHERKHAEEDSPSEREKLFNIFDAMKDGVCIVNHGYDIEFINSTVKNEFGKVSGRKCHEYFHSRKGVCPWCKNQDVFQGKTVHCEHGFENQRTYDIIATPLKNADGSISKLEIFRDITDRKRAEEELRTAKEELEVRVRERTAELSQRAAQLARLTSKLTLAEQMERRRLAGILHDHLQQFLIAAKINCEVLSENIGAEHQQYAKNIITLIAKSIQSSRTLTTELSPPILRQGRLSAALAWLSQWMRENHGLAVELQTDPDIDPKREEITLLLFQSIRELLFNIVKHAGVKSARIEMACDEKNRLRLTVIDQGPGFDPAAILGNDGAGFGLLSIRERLTHLGGRLEIESSPGRGAAISLVVPVKIKGKKKRKPIKKTITEPSLATAPGNKIRVLLADDHIVVRQGLSAMLGMQSDIEIAGEASDGKEAVRLARKIVPDVILMDINMPNINGLEATRIIHSEFPHIRIVGLSMHSEADQAAKMIQAGASTYRSKSDDTKLLLADIRNTVQSCTM